MTRIVAGVAGGRRLAVPPRETRPTSERVREALFNAVGSRMDLDGARVLDLYAGSGALGLEALSRGAAHTRFVESSRRTAEVLRRNRASLGLAGTAEITLGDVASVLRIPPAEPFDLVLADPPYDLDETALAAALSALTGNGWLARGAVLVVERSVRSAAPAWPDGVVPVTDRRYGDTRLYYGSAS